MAFSQTEYKEASENKLITIYKDLDKILTEEARAYEHLEKSLNDPEIKQCLSEEKFREKLYLREGLDDDFMSTLTHIIPEKKLFPLLDAIDTFFVKTSEVLTKSIEICPKIKPITEQYMKENKSELVKASKVVESEIEKNNNNTRFQVRLLSAGKHSTPKKINEIHQFYEKNCLFQIKVLFDKEISTILAKKFEEKEITGKEIVSIRDAMKHPVNTQKLKDSLLKANIMLPEKKLDQIKKQSEYRFILPECIIKSIDPQEYIKGKRSFASRGQTETKEKVLAIKDFIENYEFTNQGKAEAKKKFSDLLTAAGITMLPDNITSICDVLISQHDQGKENKQTASTKLS